MVSVSGGHSSGGSRGSSSSSSGGRYRGGGGYYGGGGGSGSSSNQAGIIIGCIIGAFVVLFLVIYLVARRNRNQAQAVKDTETGSTPLPDDPESGSGSRPDGFFSPYGVATSKSYAAVPAGEQSSQPLMSDMAEPGRLEERRNIGGFATPLPPPAYGGAYETGHRHSLSSATEMTHVGGIGTTTMTPPRRPSR